MLTIGGTRGEAYTLSPWENVFAAGDYEALVAEIDVCLKPHPEQPLVLHGHACAGACGPERPRGEPSPSASGAQALVAETTSKDDGLASLRGRGDSPA